MFKKTSTNADIRHIREELSLTALTIALSLAKRAGSNRVLGAIADDLEKVAQRLREQVKEPAV